MQFLDCHAFLKRLSHGIQAVLHGNGGFFLGLFGRGQAGGTHRMQGVAFARIAFPAQDGGKELRHISRRREGGNIHAERGLEQLQHRLNRLGRGRTNKQASLFRIPYAINDGRHKFRPGGQFGGNGLFQFLFALAAHLFAGSDFLPHGFGKLEADDGSGRLARVQPEGKAHETGIHGGQLKTVGIQRIAKVHPAQAPAVRVDFGSEGVLPQGVQAKRGSGIGLADCQSCA